MVPRAVPTLRVNSARLTSARRADRSKVTPDHTSVWRPPRAALWQYDRPMAADDYCYLTTTGRRSGRLHRIEIWYAADGDTVYLLSGGGRSSDWVRNLLADPEVLVEIDGGARRARGRVLEGGDEADRARSFVYAKYSARSASDLSGWRKRALPIAIDMAPP